MKRRTSCAVKIDIHGVVFEEDPASISLAWSGGDGSINYGLCLSMVCYVDGMLCRWQNRSDTGGGGQPMFRTTDDDDDP